MKIMVLALLFAGCGYQIPIAGEGYDGPTNPQPGQDQAVEIVWHQVFGITEDVPPPPIIWHFNDNCVDRTGSYGPKYGTWGAFKSAHQSEICENGQYESSGWVAPTEFDGPNRIDIEWHGSFSADQIFAHELCHAFKQYSTGDGDEHHKTDCFVGDDGLPNNGSEFTHQGAWTYTATAALQLAGY